MAHLALYREWRPKTFDEIVEQKQAVHALRQAVISGQIAHAYLFSGTRGTGKTTMAKILARAINCLEPDHGNPCNTCAICRGALDGSLMDILEMDAASNNSVDNIRRLCDEIVFMPSQARYKVYIIDEVHMLSAGAFNALLKTLEEPPQHAVFILATTEPHRIPATILSRCQRYEFRRIPVDSMVARLSEIAAQDQIDITAEALQTVAALADGALRDAISILDQARGAFEAPITHDNVLSLVGVVRDQFLQQVAEVLLSANIAELLQLVDQLVMAGRDLSRFVSDLAQHFRNLLVCQLKGSENLLVRVNTQARAEMEALASRVDGTQLIAWIRGLSALLADLRWAADGRTALEIGLIRLMDVQPERADHLPVKKTEAVRPDSRPEKGPETKKEAAQAPRSVTPEPPLPEPPPESEEPVEPEPDAPEQPDEPEPIPAPVAANEPDPDLAAVWQQALSQLQASGQMTLYLFSRPAKPQLCGQTLQLVFAADESIHYQEVSQASAVKVIREIVQQVSGQAWNIKPVLTQTGEPAACPTDGPADWVHKIRQTAQTLGIPVHMEDA
ncbi:MAG: DNA polymerase III subunit gamma/tau [Clostridiaceae bacterium]|nr:DNA polymerase III subunit gamma/tau [Clostridiaceae bacterium]